MLFIWQSITYTLGKEEINIAVTISRRKEASQLCTTDFIKQKNNIQQQFACLYLELARNEKLKFIYKCIYKKKTTL